MIRDASRNRAGSRLVNWLVNICLVAANVVLFVYFLRPRLTSQRADSEPAIKPINASNASLPGRETTPISPEAGDVGGGYAASGVVVKSSALQLLRSAPEFELDGTTLSAELTGALSLSEEVVRELSHGFAELRERYQKREAEVTKPVTAPDGTVLLSVPGVATSDQLRSDIEGTVRVSVKDDDTATLLAAAVGPSFDSYGVAKELWIELPEASEVQIPPHLSVSSADPHQPFQRWDLDDAVVKLRWSQLLERAKAEAARTGLRPGF